MTSFDYFLILYISLYFFLLKKIKCDKLHHSTKKKIKYFASNHGIITGIKIKLCK